MREEELRREQQEDRHRAVLGDHARADRRRVGHKRIRLPTPITMPPSHKQRIIGFSTKVTRTWPGPSPLCSIVYKSPRHVEWMATTPVHCFWRKW